MKFRLVWVGTENDRSKQASTRAGAVNIAHIKPEPRNEGTAPRTEYEQQKGVLLRRERLQNGRVRYTALTNFTARFVADMLRDDGEQERREFGIEAELCGSKLTFNLSASEFMRMNWVMDRLGPRAIVYPGQQQHARAAIQWTSGQVHQERIFTHLGWRKQGVKHMYLHAGGALSAEGAPPGVQVQLPSAVQPFQLQPAISPIERVQSIHASLRCLSLAADRITSPLMAAVYRAPFGSADFSMFVVGKSGVFKTALAALCQQHFGMGMDAAHLPGHFASTANALESLAFHAKDALLVIDDFAPTGRHGDDLDNIAERLFRAVGNQQGRSRMVGNGRLQQARPPRALLLATGEKVPQGQSIRARLVIVDVTSGEVHVGRLSECQRAGEDGVLARSMGAFLGWIACRYDELQQRLHSRSLEIRGQGRGRTVHARLPGALAELQSGFELWLQFARENGAIDTTDQTELMKRCERAFQEVAVLQNRYCPPSDPAQRFLSILKAALAGGQAHMADCRGTEPQSPESWGWQRKPTGLGWIPQGSRIGWVRGSDLFLDPTVSYHTAQTAAGNERLTLSQHSLHQRLREGAFLSSVDEGRQMVQVRRTMEGKLRQVLHLKATDLAVATPRG